MPKAGNQAVYGRIGILRPPHKVDEAPCLFVAMREDPCHMRLHKTIALSFQLQPMRMKSVHAWLNNLLSCHFTLIS